MRLQDILQRPYDADIRVRGVWAASSGVLPSVNKYPDGSLLLITDSGVISSVEYVEGNFLIKVLNTWKTITSSPVIGIVLIPSADNIDLDDYNGIVNSNLVLQVIYINSSNIGTALNVPVAVAGICEVYGDIDVQRYTTIDNRIFTRLIGDDWVEILEPIYNDFNVLQETIFNSYEFGPIESEL